MTFTSESEDGIGISIPTHRLLATVKLRDLALADASATTRS